MVFHDTGTRQKFDVFWITKTVYSFSATSLGLCAVVFLHPFFFSQTKDIPFLPTDGLQPDSSADENSSHSDRPDSTAAEHDSSDLELSSNDGSYAFNDAKRKLQMVLRSADLSSMPWLSRFQEDTAQRDLFTSGVQYPQNMLLAFLKALQAEAVNLQDRSLIAQLWETLRCIQVMDNNR